MHILSPGGINMTCDTCDQCTEKENMEKIEEDADQREVEKFAEEFHKHGIGCGREIAKIAMLIHPNDATIVPLYRSCIVVEQSKEEEEEGIALIHAYADPHWLGEDIDLETLKSDRFHKVFYVHGLREGPEIVPMIPPKDKESEERAKEPIME